ncbi:MAG: hypothetical protein O3C27_13520, partial [Actinomycetota bacterium]|nr:hypothetical protein [Actinomycetota bacterium]
MLYLRPTGFVENGVFVVRVHRLIPAAALLTAFSACAIEGEPENLESAVERCAPEFATNVETSYEEVAGMLAKIYVDTGAVDTDGESVQPVLRRMFDPTSTDADSLDYVDQLGEIACVTADGKLIFTVGGIIVRETQKLTEEATAAEPAPADEEAPVEDDAPIEEDTPAEEDAPVEE